MGNALELYENYYKDAEFTDERYRWIIENFFASTKDKTILEIGCGTGTLLNLLRKKNKVYGVDASKTGIEKAKSKNIESYLLDVNTAILPFADDYFDITICLETIEHLENPYHCLKEIRRVLKKNGQLLISIPNPKMLHPYFYPSLFTTNNFKQLLAITSFRVKKNVGWGQTVFCQRLLNHFENRDNFLNRRLHAVLYYFVRKANMLMRNHLGTPLSFAHCFNFECTNIKEDNKKPDIEKHFAKTKSS